MPAQIIPEQAAPQADAAPKATAEIIIPLVVRKKKPKWVKWGIAAGLVAIVIAALGLWNTHNQNVIRYETVSVERGTIQATVTATGNLNAVKDVLVSSQVSGNIKALYADWNTRVTEGQLVALIDPEIFQALVDQAAATARSAHSAVVTAQAQQAKARSDWSAAVANAKNAEAIAAKDRANEANAEAQWKRTEQLFYAGVASQQDYDAAKAAYEAYKAQVAADESGVDAAKESVASAEAQIRVADNQLEAARAQEAQAIAALRQAQINLVHTRILAPVSGVVVARRMDVGQTVASGLNPPTIFEIAQDLTKMQVDTNVDESDVGGIVVGQRAVFTVDSYPEMRFQGVVGDVRKAPIITQNVVTYDVVITVNNSDLKLFPGMTANVTILTAKLDSTLKIPNAVLRFRASATVLKRAGLAPPEAGKQQVYVLENGELMAVPIKAGLSDGKYTAVSATDLRAGQQVVTRATIGTAATTTTRAMPGGPRM